MSSIKAVLESNAAHYDNVLLWAARCLAFFGFLRCEEFTVPSQVDYDPDAHLSLADVALDDKVNPSVIQVTIREIHSGRVLTYTWAGQEKIMSNSGNCALPNNNKGSTTWPFICLHRWFLLDTAAFCIAGHFHTTVCRR